MSAASDGIAIDPTSPCVLGVHAPGGYGKSTLLAGLARLYRQAGVPVVDTDRIRATPDSAVSGGAAPDWASPAFAVLVDDAHLLGEAPLRALCRLAGTEGARLVVAYRPWPRPLALSELIDVLARSRQQVVLGPLDRDQVAGRITELGAESSAELVDMVVAQTCGVPRFVDRLVLAKPSPAEPAVPRAAIDGFRYELDHLDRTVRGVLLATALGAGRRIDLLQALLGLDLDALGDAMDSARASGLLASDGTLLPIVQRALVTLSPWERRLGLHQRLIELRLASGGSLLPLVRPLLGTPVSGQVFADAFAAAGDEVLADSPPLAAELFAAAAEAGKPAVELAARRAAAVVLSGDLDAGVRFADTAMASDRPSDRVDGERVAAAVLARRGLLGDSAELYRWAGGTPAVSFAAIGFLGAGRLADAEEALTAGDDGPPTLLSAAARHFAQGVHESVTGSATVALSTLTRASALLEPLGHTVVLPDTPAAIAALVAMHCGEFAMAESALCRAIDGGTGGTIATRRHVLLRGWAAMLRGDVDAARADLTAGTSTTPLEPRDWLAATGLELGLARRGGDLPVLRAAWERAKEAIVRHPVDLFSLLPLGEFTVAAARLGDADRLAPHLAQATGLLRDLGDPPLWTVSLHWNRVHAAIIAELPELATVHVEAVAASAGHHPYFAVIATAAREWLRVLTGDVDPAATDAAARALAEAGLPWDGARLAGQAAIRTTDRVAMLALLDRARLIQGKLTQGRHALQRESVAESTTLSGREREVAELVLAGLTYRQIGERLFISAKTVEYHVARMRQRLGCDNRGDLMNQLRALVPAGQRA